MYHNLLFYNEPEKVIILDLASKRIDKNLKYLICYTVRVPREEYLKKQKTLAI